MGSMGCHATQGNRHTWRVVLLLCLLFILPVVVHLVAAGWRAHSFWARAAKIPYPVTSLRGGGGCNPVWCGDRILYHPVNEEDGIPSGVYATDSRGVRPHVLLSGAEWYLECCDESGSLYLLREGDHRLYRLRRGKDRPAAVDCGYPIRSIAISSHGQVALLVNSTNRVVNIAITTGSLSGFRYLTHFTTADDCVDYWIPIRWYPDGTTIVFARRTYHGADFNRRFFTLDVGSGKMNSYPLPEHTTGFAICPIDGHVVAYGCDGKLFVRQGNRPAVVVAQNYSRGGHPSIDWSPDGKQIVYDGDDGNLWVATLP